MDGRAARFVREFDGGGDLVYVQTQFTRDGRLDFFCMDSHSFLGVGVKNHPAAAQNDEAKQRDDDQGIGRRLGARDEGGIAIHEVALALDAE